MKMKKKPQKNLTGEDEDDVIPTLLPDISASLHSRYYKSPSPQHHHLIATAAAMKSLLLEENLPLNPLTFFAATISAINDLPPPSESESPISPLCSLLSILLPNLPEKSLSEDKAIAAVDVMVEIGKREGVSTATMRCVVKCLGSLVLLCDLRDWERVSVAVEMIWGFCVDKRPKWRLIILH